MDRLIPLDLARISVRELNQILHHNLRWTDFFLSLRFSVEQDPSAEDDHVLSWLQLVESQALSDEMMEMAKEKPAHA